LPVRLGPWLTTTPTGLAAGGICRGPRPSSSRRSMRLAAPRRPRRRPRLRPWLGGWLSGPARLAGDRARPVRSGRGPGRRRTRRHGVPAGRRATAAVRADLSTPVRSIRSTRYLISFVCSRTGAFEHGDNSYLMPVMSDCDGLNRIASLTFT
jgi:hypothetical protein